MGRNKALLALGGAPLVERVWKKVRTSAEQVVCVGGEGGLEDKGIETIPDLFPGADSIGGIATALEHAARTLGDQARVICVACDMPLIEPALLHALAERAVDHDIVVPRTALGYEPLCAVYRAGIHTVFVAQIREKKLSIRGTFGWVDTLEVEEPTLRRFDPHLHSFLNVNRPEDMKVAERLIRGKETW
jgi:molybdopterin-guanine dinucleotide biosynthesis protein A